MNVKKLNSIFLKSLPKLFLVAVLVMLQACIQSPSNTRKALLSSSNTNTTPKANNLPVFTEGNNFFQNGGVIYTTTITFDLSFTDSLMFRGKEVDGYLRASGTSTVSCMVARFVDPLVNKVLIVAALPHSVNNYTNKSVEYYYSLVPGDETSNKNFCQKSGLINKLFAQYPALTPVYTVNAICPSGSCLNSSYPSQSLELYTPGGVNVGSVKTIHLSYNVTNVPDLSTPVGKTCTSNGECTAQGYSCCSLGQCVKDGALKTGVDTTSASYTQALADILNNPSHINYYPQYYYLCSPATPPVPNVDTTNPTTEAKNRLNALTDMYNCTTKVEGEMGICTKTITNPVLGTIYSAGIDDKNFSNTYTNQASTSYNPTAKEDLLAIQEVLYGEVTLFNADQIVSESMSRPDPYIVSPYLTINGQHNDDVATGTTVKLTSLPTNAVNKDLVIRYKIDASCTQLYSTMGKCEKYYIQGQQKSGDTPALNRRGRVTDHYPASNIFKLPYYANTSKQIVVEVDGISAKQTIDWELDASVPAVVFLPSSSGLRVTDGQKVKITYFVDLSVNHVMDSKLAALNKIKDACHCADLNCSLAPMKNANDQITDYSCVYPDPNPIVPPVSQKVYLSSKTVPVRFFDTTGNSKPAVTADTLPQEGAPFTYRKDNLLNPNNMPDITNPVVGDYYVGFNEIYGSLNYSTNSAKPAKEVAVAKGKVYDIYVDSGAYSSCIQCGNDYYSQLNRLFPLAQFGGGLVPLQARTDRAAANGIRADDLAFGRSCLLPATMIPWTHTIASNGQDQRLGRQRAQHFLYANGYQSDWYGFDYGSIIGSFDGVKWFSIGTNRRIKADTNKLFLAVNAPFGDLAIESTYTVTINDGSLNPSGANMVTTDIESDGAECQKFYQCNTDTDCATTLGWDYACTNVNEIVTSWPRFDDNAKEIPDANEPKTLVSILGNVSGKRCVYRGRGAACTPNYNGASISATSFNGNQNQSLHTCSTNNYCQATVSGATVYQKFNNKIARYGKVRTDAASDAFGLGARIIGRPYDYNGTEQVRSEALKNLNSNKIPGICIPGRSPELNTFVLQNSTAPGPEYMGDRVLNTGMTGKSLTTTDVNYYAACPVVDDTKNYFYTKGTLAPSSSNAINNDLTYSSATQNLSTNSLFIFKSILENDKKITFPQFAKNSSVLSVQAYTENRCMRAPGASCFTDNECAPSKLLTDKIKMLSSDDLSVIAKINKYELKFWQEDLICSQATAKNDPAYSPFNNRCCRDIGKTISIASGDSVNNLQVTKAPGVDIALSNPNRYSRVSTIYKDAKNATFPFLSVASDDKCSSGCVNVDTLKSQYLTFSAVAERTSCSGDWVRSFSNGDHKWDAKRLQIIPVKMFRCMNWLPTASGGNWTCAGLEEDDPDCSLIQTTPFSGKGKTIMDFLAKLELTGIPQIAIQAENHFTGTEEGDFSCKSDPVNQNSCYPGHPTLSCANYKTPVELYKPGAIAEYVDISAKNYYSAKDATGNFQTMKTIFKSDEVVSCLPAGTTMTAGADPAQCCTGFINAKTNKCQLPDFVDISVYTNRFVSSEAKKLNPNLFDDNGYIKDPAYAANLACEKAMCASGKVAYGVLISQLKTPGQENVQTKYYRFLEGSAADDEEGLLTLYTQGLKLNNHAYCLPTNTTNTGSLTVYSCGN